MRQWRACRQNPWQPIAGLQTLCGGFKQRARISRSGPLRNNDLSSMDFFFSRGSFIMDNEKIFVPAAHTHLQTKENRFPHAMKEIQKKFRVCGALDTQKKFRACGALTNGGELLSLCSQRQRKKFRACGALTNEGKSIFPHGMKDTQKNFRAGGALTSEEKMFPLYSEGHRKNFRFCSALTNEEKMFSLCSEGRRKNFRVCGVLTNEGELMSSLCSERQRKDFRAQRIVLVGRESLVTNPLSDDSSECL